MNHRRKRKGRRTVRKRPREPETQMLQDLYYLTEALQNLLTMAIQAAITGLAFLIAGFGVAKAFHLLD